MEHKDLSCNHRIGGKEERRDVEGGVEQIPLSVHQGFKNQIKGRSLAPLKLTQCRILCLGFNILNSICDLI